jgi:hypothetical protein
LPEPDSNKLLTITATVNGRPILVSSVEGDKLPGLLAKHASMDDWMAAKGLSLDDARDWIMDSLENSEYADNPEATQKLLSTLLWVACRTEEGQRLEELIRPGGVTLACAFNEHQRQEEGQEPRTVRTVMFGVLPTSDPPTVH